MNYRIQADGIKSTGPFSIYTKALSSNTFVFFEDNVSKEKLTEGKIITIPDNTQQLKFINNSDCCNNNEVIVNIGYIAPTPTPTPSRSAVILPSVTPSVTPTRTTTPTPTPTRSSGTTPTPTPTPSAGTTETVTKPAWLTNLGLTYDVVSHDCSLWIGATTDVELRIESVNGAPINGVTTGGLPWSNTIYAAGTNEYVNSPYSEVFRLNPPQSTVGGILPNTQYKVYIRRTGNINPIFTKLITTPNVSTTDISVIALTASNPCMDGPTLNSIASQTATGLTFNFHGINVASIAWTLSSGSTTRSGIVNPTSSTTTITYAQVPAGTYALAIEGASCSSNVSTLNTSIVGTTPPPTPSVAASVTPTPVPGSMTAKKAMEGFYEHMNLVITGSDKNWTITDAATVTPPSGYEFWYQINDQIIKQSTRLIGFAWASNNPITVFKIQAKLNLDVLTRYDNTQPPGGWYDPTAIVPFSYNCSVSHTEIIFNRYTV